MQTLDSVRSHEQSAFSRWVPIYYGLLFAGAFLLSLWAEVNRSKARTTRVDVGVQSQSASQTDLQQGRPAPKTYLHRDTLSPF